MLTDDGDRNAVMFLEVTICFLFFGMLGMLLLRDDGNCW